MEILIYLIIFIMGTFFGSFFTLAVYRIPKKEDILIKHSYCPNCNHKLGFFDLFPVLSYIFLGGQCRYCKQKIRPRYLLLELLSGLSFLILAISTKINIFDMNSILNVFFLFIYTSVLFIIAGIDKENIKIEKSVLVLGFCIEILYIIYQYALKNFNVYQYVIYLIIFIILFIVTNMNRRNKKTDYIIQILYLSLYILIYSGYKTYIITSILTMFTRLIYKKLTKKARNKVPLGFQLAVNNILVIAILNIINNFII